MIRRVPFPDCRSGVIGPAIAANPENDGHLSPWQEAVGHEIIPDTQRTAARRAEQGAAALRQPTRLRAGAGQCRDAAQRRTSTERVPQIRQRGRRDRGRHHIRRHADQVHRQIRRLYDHVGGFGHLLIMGQAGFLEHEETVLGIAHLRAATTRGSGRSFRYVDHRRGLIRRQPQRPRVRAVPTGLSITPNDREFVPARPIW